MTKDQIKTAGALALFRFVFDKKEGQTLAEFVKECENVKTDEQFVEEVRAFAMTLASE